MYRREYEVAEATVRQLRCGSYIRVQLEDNANPNCVLRVGREPAVNLSKKQLRDLSTLLKMDAEVLDAARLLEQNVIHGDPMMRRHLIGLFGC